MGHKVVHWELMGPNGAEMAEFYGKIFDWTPNAVPGFNEYHMVEADQAGVGGAVGQGSEDMPQYLTIYVEVEDIDAHLAKIEEAGGKTIAPKMTIPDMVTFAMFADPAGNVVGLVEADSDQG